MVRDNVKLVISLKWKKTMDSVRAIFQENGWIEPANFAEIYQWYHKEFGEPGYFGIPCDIDNRDVYILWAESTQQKKSQNEEVTHNEKGESLAVRYSMLNTLFDLKSEFKDLKENQKEHLIAKILRTSQRTAKALKNGEDKYITEAHQKRAHELIEKIKKGETL